MSVARVIHSVPARVVRLATLVLAALCIQTPGRADLPPPAPSAVRNAVHRSAAYLVRSVRSDGMLQYRINMDPDVEVSDRYNILRHAGTIYAMATHYQLRPEPDMLWAIERAAAYLRDEAIQPIEGHDNALAVWSDPEVNGSGKPRQAKLGGTGLGLVALLSVEAIRPGFTPPETLRGLGRFLVYMQKDDGSFCSKYVPLAGGRQDDWVSLYYPGEAALGLLMLHEKDGGRVWLKSAVDVLSYLARTRKDDATVPADHWALLATARLLSAGDTSGVDFSREFLIGHAAQVCESILGSQVVDPYRPLHDGGFTADGRTTPSATRLEGLQAALTFLPPEHTQREAVRAAVERGIHFLVGAQIKEGWFIGAHPRAVAKLIGDESEVESFNERVMEVRIDYVQHALSAMIQYLERVSPEE